MCDDNRIPLSVADLRAIGYAVKHADPDAVAVRPRRRRKTPGRRGARARGMPAGGYSMRSTAPGTASRTALAACAHASSRL